jgi:hypothetical protein
MRDTPGRRVVAPTSGASSRLPDRNQTSQAQALTASRVAMPQFQGRLSDAALSERSGVQLDILVFRCATFGLWKRCGRPEQADEAGLAGQVDRMCTLAPGRWTQLKGRLAAPVRSPAYARSAACPSAACLDLSTRHDSRRAIIPATAHRVVSLSSRVTGSSCEVQPRRGRFASTRCFSAYAMFVLPSAAARAFVRGSTLVEQWSAST